MPEGAANIERGVALLRVLLEAHGLLSTAQHKRLRAVFAKVDKYLDGLERLPMPAGVAGEALGLGKAEELYAKLLKKQTGDTSRATGSVEKKVHKLSDLIRYVGEKIASSPFDVEVVNRVKRILPPPMREQPRDGDGWGVWLLLALLVAARR